MSHDSLGGWGSAGWFSLRALKWLQGDGGWDWSPFKGFPHTSGSWDFSRGCQLECLHVASLRGLGFLTAWKLGTKSKSQAVATWPLLPSTGRLAALL